MARTGNGSGGRGNVSARRPKQNGGGSTRSSAGQGYTPPDPIRRGFGSEPEVKHENSDLLSIRRTDTLELPRVVQQNPFDPAPPQGGTNNETELIGATTELESAANLMLQYFMSVGPTIPLQFGAPVGLLQQTGVHIKPVYADELQRDFGTDIYQRMMNDAIVGSKIGAFFDGILDRPIVVGSRVKGDEDTEKETAQEKRFREFSTEVAAFVQANFDSMRGGFMLKLRAMLMGIPLGYKLGEMVFERREPLPGIGLKTCLQDIHPKPQEAVSIVTDRFNGVLGYLPRLRNTGLHGSFAFGDLGVRTVEDYDDKGHVLRDRLDIPDLIPPEKVCRFTWMPEDDSPTGTPHLRPAYIPWRLKIGLYPAYEAYLSRFAQPSVALELNGADIAAMAGKDGKMLTNPGAILAALLYNLRNWQAGGAFVAPVGKLALAEARGDGQAYLSAFELCDTQITTSILHAELSTQGGQYGTQALGEVHQDTTDMLFALGKYVTSQFVLDQIVRPLVFFNYGEAGLMALPDVGFGDTEQQDQTAIGTMLASLKSAAILFPPQFNAAFKKVGLPELDEDTVQMLTDLWMQTLKQQATLAEQQVQGGAQQLDAQQQAARMAQANPGSPPGAVPGAAGTGTPGQGGAGGSGRPGGAAGKQAQPQSFFGDS